MSLLEVNVLLALAWQNHVHHQQAHRWFQLKRKDGWATCALTQVSFVRLSSNPSVVGREVGVAEAIAVLERSIQSPEHEFWPMETGLTQIDARIRDRLAGPRQLTDAWLLDLAIRRNGALATFDRRLEALLPRTSSARAVIEVIESK